MPPPDVSACCHGVCAGTGPASSSSAGRRPARVEASECLAGLVSLVSCTGFPVGGCLVDSGGAERGWWQGRAQDAAAEKAAAEQQAVEEAERARAASEEEASKQAQPQPLLPAARTIRFGVPTGPESLPSSRAVASQIRKDVISLVGAMQGLLAAARAHSSATIAVLIPGGFPRPTVASIKYFGLRFHPDAKGWFPMDDGSALGLLQLSQMEAAASAGQPLRPNAVDDGESVLSGTSGRADQGQAQALGLARLRVVGLLAAQLDDGRCLLELWRASLRECHEVLTQMVPGLMAWPLHDEVVRREVLFHVASTRVHNIWSFFRVDRGRKYLDVVRLHFGEEIAFLFTWQGHYLSCVAWLALVSVPFIVVQGDAIWESMVGKYGMLVHAMLAVLFGVAVTELWPPRADRKVHRWHGQSECLSRWHRLVLGVLESKAAQRPPANPRARTLLSKIEEGQESPEAQALSAHHVQVKIHWDDVPRDFPGYSSVRSSAVEEQAREACTAVLGSGGDHSGLAAWLSRDVLLRALRASLIVPILFAEWAAIFVFFNFIVWFEIWVIFDWGGCRDYNKRVGEWKCLAADEQRGFLGLIMGALPSICEGAFFELLLAISRATANSLISIYHFPTTEGRDFAFITVVFVLEVVGKVGFILMLALAFVPVWDEGYTDGCRRFWDYSFMGELSLACLKGQVPYKVRLNMLRSAMKGPMLVSGLVGIGVKTLLPMLLEAWRRCSARDAPRGGCYPCCRRNPLARLLLAPMDFLLRVLLLIFQADFSAVSGFRIIALWPPTLVVPPSPGVCACVEASEPAEAGNAFEAPHRQRRRRFRLWCALLEGQRREWDPFNEYIEVLLHFLWTACFAIVWPLGCAFAFLNQFLEYRFDGVKLLSVRRRRFPSTRHMSVAWVPRFAQVVCHVGIFVNVAILMLPYRMASHLTPKDEIQPKDYTLEPILSTSEWPKTSASFLLLWLALASLRAGAISLCRRVLRRVDDRFRDRHSRSGLYKDREAEAMRCEQGPLSDALGDLCARPLRE